MVAASDVDAAAQRLDAVFEPDESGSTARISATHSVVCHRKAQLLVVGLHGDGDLRCAGVLGGVRQRFCDNVIGGHLNGLGQSSLNLDTQLDRYGGAATKGPQGRAQPPLGQHRRMNAVRNLPQLLARRSESVTHSGNLALQVTLRGSET